MLKMARTRTAQRESPCHLKVKVVEDGKDSNGPARESEGALAILMVKMLKMARARTGRRERGSNGPTKPVDGLFDGTPRIDDAKDGKGSNGADEASGWLFRRDTENRPKIERESKRALAIFMVKMQKMARARTGPTKPVDGFSDGTPKIEPRSRERGSNGPTKPVDGLSDWTPKIDARSGEGGSNGLTKPVDGLFNVTPKIDARSRGSNGSEEACGWLVRPDTEGRRKIDSKRALVILMVKVVKMARARTGRRSLWIDPSTGKRKSTEDRE
ncbi:hypothetical protein DFP73DRAFT_629865 [Morchella snyderi]|nr:hypothetical protein DFP73DRAFT_629865 [Morchella snyderi]